MELPCTIGRTRDPTEALHGHTIVGTIREQWHQWREADTFGNRCDRLVRLQFVRQTTCIYTTSRRRAVTLRRIVFGVPLDSAL